MFNSLESYKACLYEKELSAFMDGELSERKMERMQLHISHCENCRNALISLQQLNGVLTGMGEIEPSASFERSVLEKVALEAQLQENRSEFWRRFFTRWRPYMLAATLTILAAFLTFHPKSTGLGTEEIVIASNFEMLQNYEIINNIDMLEHLDLFLPPENDS